MKTMDLLTWNEVAARWRVSPRHARRVARRLGLFPVNLGHRTKRFGLGAVIEAEKTAGPALADGGEGSEGDSASQGDR